MQSILEEMEGELIKEAQNVPQTKKLFRKESQVLWCFKAEFPREASKQN